jgi:hypothetical protein
MGMAYCGEEKRVLQNLDTSTTAGCTGEGGLLEHPPSCIVLNETDEVG